ncbi:MAG: 16S rRNA (guanine(527)-N(7))-methyltransferase RsmG [Clostridia bacterium]|nr:16S rRNA (guanine(527)-N(7))-methyltransferase RsmG [Clostridia bacterium]
MFISEELLIKCAEEFGMNLSDDVVLKFDTYAKELVNYNEKVNLTAITEPDDIVIKHFADSLAFFKYSGIGKGDSVADVGTGAGFPGVPVLIAGDNLDVTLFDAVNKKLDFIRHLLKELDLKANVVHIRAEDAGKMPEYREKFDYVTARAVAQLRILSEFCIPLVKVDGKFVSMKGSISEEEKTNGISAFSKLGTELYDDIIYNIHNGDERNIIIGKKISQVSSKYPRNMGQISKKPL